MKTKVTSPKIQVYYIKPRKSGSIWQRLQPRRLLIYGLFLVTLFVGMGGGTFLTWTSRTGQADLYSVAQPTPLVWLRGEPWPEDLVIPIQYQESDLTVVAHLLPILIEENRHEPTEEEIKAVQRKEMLKSYLSLQKSPLATDEGALDALLRARNMRMILAISFVESNICKKQVSYNCSGIGGSNMRKYPNFGAWIDDFDSLLDRRYKDLPVEKFIGYYVQPGSQNWVDGVYQILGDLNQAKIE